MLVLSRKLGEKIFIGENIVITVVAIDRGKIRLGISAPRDTPIYREELIQEPGRESHEVPPLPEGDGVPAARPLHALLRGASDPPPVSHVAEQGGEAGPGEPQRTVESASTHDGAAGHG